MPKTHLRYRISIKQDIEIYSSIDNGIENIYYVKLFLPNKHIELNAEQFKKLKELI